MNGKQEFLELMTIGAKSLQYKPYLLILENQEDLVIVGFKNSKQLYQDNLDLDLVQQSIFANLDIQVTVEHRDDKIVFSFKTEDNKDSFSTTDTLLHEIYETIGKNLVYFWKQDDGRISLFYECFDDDVRSLKISEFETIISEMIEVYKGKFDDLNPSELKAIKTFEERLK